MPNHDPSRVAASSVVEATRCYRSSGVGAWLVAHLLRLAPAATALLRRWKPVLRLGRLCVVTRHDDVRAVFEADAMFGVPYKRNLDIVTGGPAFFLGLGDGPDYRGQLDAMRAVVRPSDLAALGDAAEARAAALVDAADGRIELVGLVRRVGFDLLGAYFGVPEPAVGRLDVWASRLFEFQFTGAPDNAAWLAEVRAIGAAFRARLDRVIAARKAASHGSDDILARCLAFQAAGRPGYGDDEIRTALLCMMVGGPPQPPMVVPQAIEQLLRRPAWLAEARAAARDDDDGRLRAILFEAMRFDPLAPALKRTALVPATIAPGTGRATSVPQGTTIFVAFASAMMDAASIPDPKRFDPDRPPAAYLHFGHGLHECFGRHINHATLHRIVKPLLARPALRRAPGPPGRLRKRGAFADRLDLLF